MHEVSIPYGQNELKLEWGKVAKQANGAVVARVGGRCASRRRRQRGSVRETGILSLTVDYREKFYASGRIPGGFIKREGRPSDNETLRARLIDRAIRPCSRRLQE